MAASKVFPVTAALPSIFYEDPEPVEDGMQQAPIIVRVVSMLMEHFKGKADVFVSGGGFIFYDPSNGNRRIAPDLFIAFDVDVEGIRKNLPNYLIWQIGKPPDFVLEVASPSTAANDLGYKRDLYASLGMTEYWRLDPAGGDLYGQPLTGERLVDGEYRPYELHTDEDGSIWAHSEVLDLRFHWDLELEDQFDVRSPLTGRTIHLGESRRQELVEERAARLAKLERLREERQARLAAQSRLREERRERFYEQLESAARERELRAEIERLRRQLPGGDADSGEPIPD